LRSLTSFGGTVKILNTWWTGLIAYLIGAVGVTVLAIQLFGLVLVHTIVLAWPHLQGAPPKLSLIQQRRIDAAVALPPSPAPASSGVAAAEAPTLAPEILAAQLDLSEQDDSAMVLPEVAAFELHSEPSSVAIEPTRLRVAHARSQYTQLTAADIFNRSFGVITTAAN
jgi:hypothetical protein